MVDQTIITVKKVSGIKNKSVIGIYSSEGFANKDMFTNQTHIDALMASGYKEININALGEGGINVCSSGGNIEIGDYICSSSIKGKGMKQDDDLLHNYTVAKALSLIGQRNNYN